MNVSYSRSWFSIFAFFTFFTLMCTSTNHVSAQTIPKQLYRITLNSPAQSILEFSPVLATENNKELCTKYGYCTYKIEKIVDAEFNTLRVTTYQDTIIGIETTTDITKLNNPPCDAYQYVLKTFGKPIRKRVTKGFTIKKDIKYKKDGIGIVETLFDSTEFDKLCENCKINNTHESVYLIEMEFPQGLGINITPEEILYSLKNESMYTECTRSIKYLVEKEHERECAENRDSAIESLKKQNANGD